MEHGPEDFDLSLPPADLPEGPSGRAHPAPVGKVERPPPTAAPPRKASPDNGELSLPHSDAAERALLAACIMAPQHIEASARVVRDEDLYRQPHRLVWRALLALHAGAKTIDLLTVARHLEDNGALAGVGGKAWLSGLLDGEGLSRSAEGYAHIIARLAYRRRCMDASVELVDNARRAPDETLQDIVAELYEQLRATRPLSPIPALPLSSVTAEWPSWLVQDLIPSSGLVLLWAQPGTGKTYLLLRAAVEMLADPPAERLWTHPHLRITRPLERVLWVATEETAGRLRARADMVERGLGASGRRGEVTHVHASTCRPRLTLDDLPELLDRTKAELVILDSLTGLRPRQIRGRDVRWDVDNDATEELTSGLRALTTERGVPLILVHHTGREVAKGYRGPTAWWAAADVQIGLEPDTLTGTIKVTTEKSRDSGRLVPFRIRPEWTPEGFRIEYQGETVAKPLGHIARQVLAFLKGRGPTVQSEITKLLGFKRQRVSVAVKELIEAELVMYGQQIDARTPTLVLVEDCPDCPNSEADNPLE